MSSVRVAVLLVILAAPARVALAQVPATFTNLQALPKDIRRDSLVDIMRRFSLSLSVRCEYCHVSGVGGSIDSVDYAKDDRLPKRRARFMIRMLDSLNRHVLPGVPGAEAAPFRMECKTCHRGNAQPLLLTQLLERVRDSAGIDAAVARYRTLRENEGMEGRYDFGEWEMNLWAEQLARSGRVGDAVAVYVANLEHFPRSFSILGTLGRMLEPTDRNRAIEYYERSLAIRAAPGLRRRVDSLKAIPPGR